MKCRYCGNHFEGDPVDMSMWEHRGVRGNFCSLECVSSKCYVIETSKKITEIRETIEKFDAKALERRKSNRVVIKKWRKSNKVAIKKWRENAKIAARIAAKNAQERRRNEELHRRIINPSGKTYCHHCIDNDATCQRTLNGRITPLCSKCSNAIISGIPCSVGFPLFGNEPPFPMGANKRKPMLHELDEKFGEPVSNHGFRVITQDFYDWRD